MKLLFKNRKRGFLQTFTKIYTYACLFTCRYLFLYTESLSQTHRFPSRRFHLHIYVCCMASILHGTYTRKNEFEGNLCADNAITFVLHKLLPTTLTSIHSNIDNGKKRRFIGNGSENPMRSCHRKPITAKPTLRVNHSDDPGTGTSLI